MDDSNLPEIIVRLNLSHYSIPVVADRLRSIGLGDMADEIERQVSA